MRNDVLVLRPLDLLVRGGKDDLDMAWVALVWVDATVRTVGAAARFGSLLHDDVFDVEVFECE